VVFEDADVLAFHHTRPFWPVHIVVVPKLHVDSLLTLPDAGLASRLLEVVQSVAADVVAEHGRASVMTNLGDYQDSKHLHVHVRAGEPLRGA
jgi:histidine triad (HIT) family protein